MSLRVKVELVLFIVVSLVVGLGYGIQRQYILPKFLKLEETDAAQDVVRVREAIQRQIEQLDTLCQEWAARPDVRRLLEPDAGGGEQGGPGTVDLVGDDLNIVCVIRADGEVAWRATIDPATQKAVMIAGFGEKAWPASHPLLSFNAPDSSTRGVFSAPEAPVLVASRPLTAGDEPEAPAGTLVIGRLLDERLLRKMVKGAYLGFRIWSAKASGFPEEERAVLRQLADSGSSHYIRAFSDMFIVYTTYLDIEGAPAFLLRADVDRALLARAEGAMREGLLAQVGIGLAALVVLVVLFRRGVMNSLSRLTAHTIAIGKTNDLSARLNLERNDEIGTLASEFDRAVARLDEDIRERERAEEALRESEERYALAVEGAHDGLWDWNLRTNEIYFSPRWKSMLGYDDAEVRREPEDWLSKVHPEDRPLVLASLDAHLKGTSAHFESEYRIRHKDESYLWVLCRGLGVRGEDGEPTRMAGSQTDITPRKRIEEQLTHQAFHDELTALPNRALFLDRLGQALRHAERHKEYTFAVLFLDLDRFKVVNDGLGHLVGDKLLTSIANKLTASLRATDTVARSDGTVARFGGDEFVILLDEIRDVSDATRVAERIQEILKQPFQIDDHEVFTSASIGIAMGASGRHSAVEILRNADTAMYRAKAHGKARYEVFDADMHAKALTRLQLETDLRRATERNEFVVYYQPIISLETGRVEAFEALVRWEHPTRGTVSPLEFIPVAEETGMIVPIGQAILSAAARDVRIWQQTMPHAENLCVSVNLSVREFSQPDLVESIQRTLDDAGLDPRYLKLEITESAIMENVDYVFSTLTRLRKLDIALAIDDFGTGYSSLSYLHRFPMNTLKIDRAFVRDMHVAAEHHQIVKTIRMLAESLGMNVIAEGIENEDQLRQLRDLGCEYGQGYLFSPPIDTKAATDLLAP
ncbi:MAG TPA: EAL domain-containing protein, partial [Candidatus Hydrogenedentes bacterium]|nr:EAL domain-containing protein [Candidatus Hydrogenedentota bacterium]